MRCLALHSDTFLHFRGPYDGKPGSKQQHRHHRENRLVRSDVTSAAFSFILFYWKILFKSIADLMTSLRNWRTICTVLNMLHRLNGSNVTFGMVVDGMDVLTKIEGQGNPTEKSTREFSSTTAVSFLSRWSWRSPVPSLAGDLVARLYRFGCFRHRLLLAASAARHVTDSHPSDAFFSVTFAACENRWKKRQQLR